MFLAYFLIQLFKNKGLVFFNFHFCSTLIARSSFNSTFLKIYTTFLVTSMAACKRPKFEYPNHVDGKSLLEIVELSKERLEALIKNETTHPNTRFTWKLYLRLLNHNFCTKSTVEFWGDHLGRMFNFIMMSVKAQTLFLRMFTRTKRWHIVGKIE